MRIILALLLLASDWPQFRGPNGTGVSADTGLPAEMSPAKNVFWKTALQTAGYPIRKVGLSKGSQRGIHHVLETYVDGHWVLLDGLSNLSFRHPDGSPASGAW